MRAYTLASIAQELGHKKISAAIEATAYQALRAKVMSNK